MYKRQLNDNQKTYKYLFATEYVENDNKLYDILKDITGKPSFDEEAFNNGDISVVFVDENIDGDYDDTLSEGMDINLMKYYCNINGSFMYDRAWQNSGSYNKALSIYIKDKGYSSHESWTCLLYTSCGQSSNRLHKYTSRYKLKRLYKKDRHTRHTYILNKNNYVKETYKRLMLGPVSYTHLDVYKRQRYMSGLYTYTECSKKCSGY